MMTKMMKKMNMLATKTTEKTKQMFLKTIEKIDDSISAKNPLFGKGVSKGSTIAGAKRMTINEFNHKGIYRLDGHLNFTPAHKAFEFKISHSVNIYMLYQKRANVTYVLIVDEGFIDWSIVPHMKKNEGLMIKFNGLVSFKDFINSDFSTKVLTKLYNERAEEMRREAAEESAVAA